MEPDDQELIKKILDHYKWQDYDNTIDVQAMSAQSYKVVTSPSAYRHMDLSSVSTRDLLNECYRRRAIEKFDFKVEADSLMLKDHPATLKHVMKNLVDGLFETIISDEKFSADAIHIKEELITTHFTKVFRGELYVCKHPTKVKR